MIGGCLTSKEVPVLKLNFPDEREICRAMLLLLECCEGEEKVSRIDVLTQAVGEFFKLLHEHRWKGFEDPITGRHDPLEWKVKLGVAWLEEYGYVKMSRTPTMVSLTLEGREGAKAILRRMVPVDANVVERAQEILRAAELQFPKVVQRQKAYIRARVGVVA
jgi:hypothetical protein